MASAVGIDVDLLKREIKKTYASVSEEPERDFSFPTGRAWAEDLDYPPELAVVPETAAESFAGVANPFSLGRLAPGERVLDLGSGAGTDELSVRRLMILLHLHLNSQPCGLHLFPRCLPLALADGNGQMTLGQWRR